AGSSSAPRPILVLACLFFFSSRRRHTRWPRDWSSDVCSSDLSADIKASYDRLRAPPAGVSSPRAPTLASIATIETPDPLTVVFRSEERRVGKECRSWWSL